MKSSPTIPYRPDIDGLRALAVLPVLLFHADLGCPGGYVGVDIFFVISGYLIGSLVIAEIERGTFSMRDFWERRIRRIFPALAVVVFACLFVGWALLVPEHLAELGQSMVAQPLLIANFYYWLQTGYFETASEFQPLLHTWSLAVEEQFYLFFPLIMILLLKGGRKIALIGVFSFVAASLCWSLYATSRYPSLSFFLIPSRIWELDVGVILALFSKIKIPNRLVREFLCWVGFVFVFVSIWFFDKNTPFPHYAALLPCLGAGLLIFGSTGGLTSIGKLLSFPVFVFVGKISYSLYLWHWPVIVFWKYYIIRDASPLSLLGCLVVSFLLACLSWRFIESPFRRKEIFSNPRNLYVFAGSLSVLMIVLGGLLYSKQGFPQRFPSDTLDHSGGSSPYYSTRAFFHFEETGEFPIIGDTESESAILLWGDSHAIALMSILDTLGKESGIAVHCASHPGVAPVLNTYSKNAGPSTIHYGETVLAYLEEKKIDRVFITARWAIYTEGEADGRLDSILSDNDTMADTAEQAQQVFKEALRETITALQERGVSPYLMRDVGLQPRSVPETLAQVASRGMDLNALALPLKEHRKARELVDRLIDEAVADSGITIGDPFPYFVDKQGRYLMARRGRALYGDRHHLTPYGAEQLRPLLLPLFEKK